MSSTWFPTGVRWTDDWKAAAVLIPYYEIEGEGHIVLTVRSEFVAHHKGQIAFPGGAAEPHDKSLWETALRESQEEIGLQPEHVEPLRTLQAQYTPTRFCVTPFVGQLKSLQDWMPCPREIASVFSVPLAHLRRPENYEFSARDYAGQSYLDPQFRYQDYVIWGVTGRILCDFLEIQPALGV